MLLAVIAAFMVIPGAAAADAQGGENLNGQIRQPTTVEGLEITVYEGTEGDEVIGEATTDSEGRWEVELPGPGDYRVVLDEESVPDEYVVPEKPGSELDVEVRPDQQRTVVFRLQTPEEAAEESASPSAEDGAEGGTGAGDGGAAEEEGAEEVPGVDAGASFGDKFVQLAVSGVIFGLIIAISSVGLSLIFGTTKMINFAHGDMVTFGAFMAMMFSTMTLFSSLHESVAGVPVLGFLLNPLVVGLVLAVVLGGGLGMFLERFLWRPLRKRHVALIQMFIVTIGVSLILRHVLLVLFGARREKYEQFRIQQPLELGPVSITPRDLAILLLSVAVLVLVASMLQFTRIGKAMRAVADNRDLAESSGIDVDRVTLYVWGLGGSLSALGGVFYGLNQTVHWQMGFHLLLLMFAGVILGGLGTAYGAMVGGLVVGLVAMLSTLWFSPQLMNVWALGIMILVLLVRPQGILGRRERVG
ncbi:branched-chain amino acid ABC transporter permease [Nocardiopsis sp. CNT-189]|uniref:ABC transporter permease subunit n=1 Tax=Nocardiopsis oceanisediminis TaxID=2816862 RepID=UPI003B2F79B0